MGSYTPSRQNLVAGRRMKTLPRIYNIWGQVVSGLEIVKYIAQGGVRNGGVDGAPLRTIGIERAITSNS